MTTKKARKNEPGTNVIKEYEGMFWNTYMPRTTSLYYMKLFFITQLSKHSSLMSLFLSHVLIRYLNSFV